MTQAHHGDVGPPEKDEGRTTADPADTDITLTSRKAAGRFDSKGSGRDSSVDTVAQTRRRRAASSRMVPVASRHRDPWLPWRPEKLSDKQIDGAAAAAEHLEQFGTPGIFPEEMCRAMHHAGHRDLAWTCFSYSSGQAA